ncbi:MAG: AbrB/MazE/SpoVT family DNA-binding domain-containing protein [Candidatus Nitrotoga sp.]
MLIKTTPNSQIASPEIDSQVEVAECFDVEINSPSAVLPPVLPQCAEDVRRKLVASGISEKDVAGASAWARRPKE